MLYHSPALVIVIHAMKVVHCICWKEVRISVFLFPPVKWIRKIPNPDFWGSVKLGLTALALLCCDRYPGLTQQWYWFYSVARPCPTPSGTEAVSPSSVDLLNEKPAVRSNVSFCLWSNHFTTSQSMHGAYVIQWADPLCRVLSAYE